MDNYIITGLQPWDIEIGSNAKDIALEISKQNRVLYISTPLDIKTYFKKDNLKANIYRRQVVKKEQPILRKINKNLYVLDFPFTILPVYFLPDGVIFDFVNKLNNKRMYSFINNIIKDISFEKHVLFIDNDVFRSFYAAEFLKPEKTIYYRRDNLRSEYWIKHVERLESALCSKSDVVLSNSEELAVYAKQYQKNTYCIGQGVDLSNYSINKKYTTPIDIIDINRPIIGYTGNLTSMRLDVDLIYNLAKHFDKNSFVLVGEEDSTFKKHVIHSLPNVHFLGTKDINIIPNYIKCFDICLNPQLKNEITMGNYPRKIDEYLSLGKSVVATDTSTMLIFKDHCHLCNDINDYIKSIESCLTENIDEINMNQRASFANSHSWENSVSLIYKYIKQIS